MNHPFVQDYIETIDYILHLVSDAHPLQHRTDLIETIITNIIGLRNMLEFTLAHNTI